MKKCSHSAHHSLTEMNITPLLDLAFVLLVIFIITTIPPVTEEDLKLPSAVRQMKDPPPKAVYISVLSDGTLFLDKTKMADASEMLNTLIGRRTIDQDLNVIVRGDGKTKYKAIRNVLDICQQANIGKLELATDIAK